LLKEATTSDVIAFYRSARSELDNSELCELVDQLGEKHGCAPDTYISMLRLAIDAHGLDYAVARSYEATDRFPDDPRLWLLRSEAHLFSGEGGAAHEAIRRAEQVGSTSELEPEFAWILIRLGAQELARSRLEKRIEHVSTDWKSILTLGRLHLRMGRVDVAHRLALDALCKIPLDPDLWILASESSDTKAEGEALIVLANDAANRLNSTAAWLIASRLEASLPRRQAALERALALDRKSVSARDCLAEVLAERDRFTDACNVCRAADGDRLPIQLRARRIWLDARQGDLEGAVTAMNKLVHSERSCAWPYWQLLHWPINEEEHTRADAAEELIRLEPKNPDPWLHQGWEHRAWEEFEEAIACFRHALVLEPDLPDVAEVLKELEEALCQEQVASAGPRIDPSLKHVFVDGEYVAVILKREGNRCLVRYKDACGADEWVTEDRIR
jgi:tetratricopeptide (TPR) repeat protein